jgi:hypothetical protein
MKKMFVLFQVQSFPDRINHYVLGCVSYFRSGSARLRANAAAITGFLLTALTQPLRGTISKDLIFAGSF